MTFTAYQVQPVLDLIGKYESRGDYTIVWGGLTAAQRPAKTITGMTVAEVMAWQNAAVKKGAKSTAAGKYQIIRATLGASVAALKLNTARLFDKATQDELGMHLLRGRGMQRFLDGQIDADDMAIGLAKEWASLPVPHDMQGQSRRVKAGQSYYSGDGLNAAHAKVAEVEQALAIARERYRAGSAPSVPQATPTTSPAAPGFIGIALAIAAAAAFFLTR